MGFRRTLVRLKPSHSPPTSFSSSFQTNACAVEAIIDLTAVGSDLWFQTNACAVEAPPTSGELDSNLGFRRTLVRLKRALY